MGRLFDLIGSGISFAKKRSAKNAHPDISDERYVNQYQREENVDRYSHENNDLDSMHDRTGGDVPLYSTYQHQRSRPIEEQTHDGHFPRDSSPTYQAEHAQNENRPLPVYHAEDEQRTDDGTRLESGSGRSSTSNRGLPSAVLDGRSGRSSLIGNLRGAIIGRQDNDRGLISGIRDMILGEENGDERLITGLGSKALRSVRDK